MVDMEIAGAFRELAGLMEKKRENRFKIRSYLKVAEEIEIRQPGLATMTAQGKLRQIPGVGDAIEKKIIEMLTTGKLQLIERLKGEIAETAHEKARQQ